MGGEGVGEKNGRDNRTEGGWEWRGMDLIKVHTYRELYQTT